MRLIEAKFVLRKNIEIKELGIKFRKLNSKEKEQIIYDLKKHYFDNPFLKQAEEMEIKDDEFNIEKIKFWHSLDDVNREICMFNNLLLNQFKLLSIDETISKLNRWIVIECDENILSEFIDKNKTTKFISNLLSLYGIYSSPLEMTERVKFDYSYILEADLLDRTKDKYYADLILNCVADYKISEGENISLKFVNISQKYLLHLQKLISTFNKADIRAFVTSIDLLFTESFTAENRIINMTSIIEKLLISSDENIQKDFILKSGLILKRLLKTKNDMSNTSIKSLLSFSYTIRSCIVHGNEEKIIDSLSKLIKKDKTMQKLCKITNNSHINKIKNAYMISEMMLYLTLRAVIKYWFDYPSELKFIKMN